MTEAIGNPMGHFLSVDQLRLGIFVMIDLPWFKHNFTLNSFKIRNEDQLRELRSLKLPRYRYDPDRSDPLAIAALSAPAAPSMMSAPVVPVDAIPESDAQLATRERIAA